MLPGNKKKCSASKDKNMKITYCIKKCNTELDNEHIVWCKKMNKESDYKYSHILNGDITEKKEALKQIQMNNRKREEENEPCDPVV